MKTATKLRISDVAKLGLTLKFEDIHLSKKGFIKR